MEGNAVAGVGVVSDVGGGRSGNANGRIGKCSIDITLVVDVGDTSSSFDTLLLLRLKSATGLLPIRSGSTFISKTFGPSSEPRTDQLDGKNRGTLMCLPS